MAQTFGPSPGDLLVDSSSSIVLEPANDSTRRVTITNSKISAPDMDFGEVELNGSNLSSRINTISSKSGVGDSNVKTSHIQDNSVQTSKFALMSVAKGGTGLSTVGEDEVLFAISGNEVKSSPDLTADGNGLYLNGTLKLTDTANTAKFYESNNDLMVDFNGDVADLGLANKGTPPTINSVSLNNNELAFELQDPDGDLRSLHLIWYNTQKWPNPQNVVDLAALGTPSFDLPAGSNEIELFAAVNTGSESFRAVYQGAPLSGKYIYAVAEDGPGNLSEVVEYYWS